MLVLRAGLKSSYGSLFLIGGYIFNYLEVYLVREINLILCKEALGARAQACPSHPNLTLLITSIRMVTGPSTCGKTGTLTILILVISNVRLGWEGQACHLPTRNLTLQVQVWRWLGIECQVVGSLQACAPYS